MTIQFGPILVALVAIVVAIAVLWWILAKLYQRSTPEMALVRTGLGGERVAISGGALVIPVVHEATRVAMTLLRIGVSHRDQDALITQDRLRVNVDADFYVRVRNDRASVATAARTLGTKTANIEAMRALLGARFDDALRTAAARHGMETLHEDRGAFAAEVRALAAQGIEQSGLEIDSVAISRLDQASREFFNPNNAFDAAGLTRLTAEIEERRRLRNEIERDAQVEIQRKNLEAEQRMLELQREEEYARLAQEREVAIRRAQQQSQITVEAAEMKRASQVAEVGATEMVEKARLASDRTVREEKVRLEQHVREIEIARQQAIEMAETARRQALELAQQATEIEIAAHSQKRNAALADAERSRALAVKAEEAVISARELERAEREKALALVGAAREAETRGLAAIKSAEAELAVAERRADIVRTAADAESAADALRTRSADTRYEIEARGKRALNEAENLLSESAMEMRTRLAAIDKVEAVVRESAKPLERIGEIKIVHVDGLSGLSSVGGGVAGDATGATQGSVSDQVMSSALKYRLQAPLVDSLLLAAGLKPVAGGGLKESVDRKD